MAINFNSLPSEKPSVGTIIPKGTYRVKIAKADMRQPKDETKPEYLNLELDVTDEASMTPMGKMWAIITESEAPLPRYQLSRLIKALNLPITGEFELKDLTKMVVNKELRADICPEEPKDGSAPKKSVIDVSAEIFYPLNDTTMVAAEAIFSAPEATVSDPTVPMSSY